MPGLLDEEASRITSALLEKRGIRLLFNQTLEEILGEVEVKAVRFKNGKVMACEAVILEDMSPDLRFLEEGELVMAERIPVAGTMRTNVESVYAIDCLAQLESPKLIGNYSLSRADVERQGETAVLAAFGEAVAFDRAVVDGRVLLESVFSVTELSELKVAPDAAGMDAPSEAVTSSGSGTDPAGTSGG